MCLMPVCKGTILIPNFHTPHLHFICNDPVFYPGLGKECVLLVNISSIKPNIPYDKSCVLDVGEHPFITKPSFIYSSAGIQLQIAEGNYSVREDCNESVFKRILNGFSISKEVTIKVFRFYEKYCADTRKYQDIYPVHVAKLHAVNMFITFI